MDEAEQEIVEYGLRPDGYIILPSLMLPLVAVCVCLRIYVRGFLIRSFGLDDWLLLISFAVFAGDAACFIRNGFLVKRDGIVKDLLEIGSLGLASVLMYLTDQILLKASMALFFLRIPQQLASLDDSDSNRYILDNIIFGKCHSWHVLGPLNYIATVLNALMDWIFVAIPIGMIWQMNLNKRAKLQACCVISIGALGSIFSVARIPLIPDINVIPSFHYFGRIVPIFLLGFSETAVGTIAISLAACRPLLQNREPSSSHGSGSRQRKQDLSSNGTRDRFALHTIGGRVVRGSLNSRPNELRKLKAGEFHISTVEVV